MGGQLRRAFWKKGRRIMEKMERSKKKQKRRPQRSASLQDKGPVDVENPRKKKRFKWSQLINRALSPREMLLKVT
jgi:hypothetical protein